MWTLPWLITKIGVLNNSSIHVFTTLSFPRSWRCFTIQHVKSKHYITIRFSWYIFTKYMVLPRRFSMTHNHDPFISVHDVVSGYNMLHQHTKSRYIVHDTFSSRFWLYQYGCSRQTLTTLSFSITTVFHDLIRYINTLTHDTLLTTHFHDTCDSINMMFHDTYQRHIHSHSWRCFAIQIISSTHYIMIQFSRYIFTTYLVLPR